MPGRFLSKRVVLAIHRDLVETFGGRVGIRDEAALESALHQPQATYGQELLHPHLEDQAAAYLFHLCRAHPFVDGNKRVAFATADVFLRLNGYRLTLSDDEAYRLTTSVARGETDKQEIARILKASMTMD